jgi:hypothetical protein
MQLSKLEGYCQCLDRERSQGELLKDLQRGKGVANSSGVRIFSIFFNYDQNYCSYKHNFLI